MLIEYTPGEWESVVKHDTCPFHKKHPEQRYPGCTCFSSYSMRRKDTKVIVGSSLVLIGNGPHEIEKDLMNNG